MTDGTTSPNPSPSITPADIAPAEIIHVDERSVPCDGGGGPLGHPRVWLRLMGGEATCPYCSRKYILTEGAGDDHGH